MAKKPGKGKSGKKVRVQFRSNRGKPPREKDVTRQYQEQGDAHDEGPAGERVRAKGGLSRKRTVIEGGEVAASDEADQGEGVVVLMQGPIARVDDGDREWACTIRRVLRTRLTDQRHPVAVGDRVRFTRVNPQAEADQQGVVEKVLPRRSELTRRYGGRVHTIVSNVDRVVVVVSVGVPELKPHLIDRYLVAVERCALEPIICINKADVDEFGEIEEMEGLYRSLGYTCLGTSAVDGRGLEALRSAMAGHQSVVTGQSGVGKSSLLNALQPGLGLAVRAVSAATFKGRHTTVQSQMVKLDFGGYVVDTPGVRQFELVKMALGELEACFVEFVPLVAGCEYADCKHIPEQGCAIKAAVEDGRVDEGRYESYVRMFEELKRGLQLGVAT